MAVRRIALPLVLALVWTALRSAGGPGTAAFEDWPEFRGPTGQGHSSERGVPFEWSETRNVVWKTPVPGSGWSSPVVAGGRVWMTTATADRTGASLRALAFDVETGREAVNVEVFRLTRLRPLNEKNSRASPTPILEGDRVYSASPVFADERIYFQSEEGVTTVIAPERQFRRLATSRLDGATLASMAVSGGSVFIRSDSHLYRIGARSN